MEREWTMLLKRSSDGQAVDVVLTTRVETRSYAEAQRVVDELLKRPPVVGGTE